MKPKAYAVLIHPGTPEVLLTMLKQHIHTYGKMKMIFASSVTYEQSGFLGILALATKGEKPRRISIPSQYILVIADTQDDLESGSHVGYKP